MEEDERETFIALQRQMITDLENSHSRLEHLKLRRQSLNNQISYLSRVLCVAHSSSFQSFRLQAEMKLTDDSILSLSNTILPSQCSVLLKLKLTNTSTLLLQTPPSSKYVLNLKLKNSSSTDEFRTFSLMPDTSSLKSNESTTLLFKVPCNSSLLFFFSGSLELHYQHRNGFELKLGEVNLSTFDLQINCSYVTSKSASYVRGTDECMQRLIEGCRARTDPNSANSSEKFNESKVTTHAFSINFHSASPLKLTQPNAQSLANELLHVIFPSKQLELPLCSIKLRSDALQSTESDEFVPRLSVNVQCDSIALLASFRAVCVMHLVNWIDSLRSESEELKGDEKPSEQLEEIRDLILQNCKTKENYSQRQKEQQLVPFTVQIPHPQLFALQKLQSDLYAFKNTDFVSESQRAEAFDKCAKSIDEVYVQLRCAQKESNDSSKQIASTLPNYYKSIFSKRFSCSIVL